MYIKDSSDGSIRDMLTSIGDYLNSPRDVILLYDVGGSFSTILQGRFSSIFWRYQKHYITGGTYGST